MSLRQLVISENAEFQEVKNPHTGKVFFTCGKKKGYVSPAAQEKLQDPNCTIDDFQFAEVAKPGEKPVPCIMIVGNSQQNVVRKFGGDLLRANTQH
jgi:hypothetical protein